MQTYKVSFSDKTRSVEVRADGFRFSGGNQFVVFRRRGRKNGKSGGAVAAWPVERIGEIRLVEAEAAPKRTTKV